MSKVSSQRVHLSLIEISDRSEESSTITIDRIVSSRTLGLVAIAREYSTMSRSNSWENPTTTISCMDIFFDDSLSLDSKNPCKLL